MHNVLKAIQIVDCTIRDGGYVNNWEFDVKMVKELYRHMSKSGVDFIELGYRNKPSPATGIWMSVSEDLLLDLCRGISGVPIALMIDTGKADVEQISMRKDSAVSLYRIACHHDKIDEGIFLAESLKAKGYLTSIQLMGIAGYNNKDLESIIQPLAQSTLDYVYFADSYGSLFPADIKKYITLLKQTDKKIGFHAHNGLQLAFANTLEALNHGIDIIDGTVYGMGRGAGNLPLEVLLMYFEKNMNCEQYNVMPVLDLIDRYFITMQKETPWGYSLPYMLSGIFEVHPDYAKTLVDYHEYKMDDMVKILDIIKGLGPIGFKKETLDHVVQTGFPNSTDTISEVDNSDEVIRVLAKDYPATYVNRHSGRDFLVLGNGPTLKEYKKDIDTFIEKYNPIIMGANYLGDLFTPHYHGFSNKKRFMTYADQVSKKSQLLISSSFENTFIREYTTQSYERIIHLNRITNVFDIKEQVLTSNCRTISNLLIGVSIIMGAHRIFIAGMDGYKNKENFLSHSTLFYQESVEAETFNLLIEKHNWNEAVLRSINDYLTDRNKEGLSIITPTSHTYFYRNIQHWIKQYTNLKAL